MRSRTAPYQTQVTALGGRSGAAASADGRLKLRLDGPRDPAGKGTNPEQLFAAAYAACFLSSLQRVARDEGVELAADSNVTASVGLGERLSVLLSVDLPGVAEEEAARLAAAAHRICPYSRAIRGNVEVRLSVA
ncbi:Ohr family peroxiredoxin [Rhizorhabdus dicambivorans]|uniref:Organic hydroperoxide resistance protein n=1 Tax=Rhizorhabdus dicambivorans TaxID=1850238 RepID=A0A2A4FWP4_9SPHN|nr:Ohr family peroxiredoxin [Rhizorhabdus dicambivorans]ATE63039.1 organic hydroperoxide resistance protein [Rhizorhabdus dicambivorans]PCE43216.1 organic hydroperoxide resistance protein [Rhizorhabdus dicambivorans]